MMATTSNSVPAGPGSPGADPDEEVEPTSHAGPDPPPPVAYSKWFTHVDVDERTRTVTYRGQAVWAATGSHISLVEDKTKFLQDWDLESEVKSLLLINESRTKIDEKRLLELVKECGGDEACAKHVSFLTNGDPLKVVGARGEMFYQVAVFPPVSLLLNCFASDPDQFTADQKVWSGYHCCWTPNNALPKSDDVEYSCHPDAALCATPRPSLVLGAMELTGDETGAVDQKDLLRCAALTTITAVALIGEGVTDQIAVPFVTNVKGRAFLYVTTMRKDAQPPVVELMDSAFLSQSVGSQEKRVKLIATLAVLLHRNCKLLMTSEGETLLSLLATRGVASSKRSEDVSSSAARRRSCSSRKRSRGAEPVDPVEVAGSGGNVANLTRIRPDGHEGSPYYFVGDYGGKDEPVVPVFVKIWRQGDEGANPRRIQCETELVQLAHWEGVPCPEVISKLTAMSVDHEGSIYHRLVMRRLANDPTLPHDLEHYSKSLIWAALTLHRAGILHCDIKPSNVVWNAATKTAHLVDFGHAQLEAGAKAYVGTDGYTSPEVQRHGEPHSRRSDAYSIGKTILEVGRRAHGKSRVSQGDSPHHCWIRVAEALSREDPRSRLTLEQALDELRRAGLSPSARQCTAPHTAPGGRTAADNAHRTTRRAETAEV
jgi:hypothetical protein